MRRPLNQAHHLLTRASHASGQLTCAQLSSESVHEVHENPHYLVPKHAAF